MEFKNLSDRPLIFRGSKEGLKKMIVMPDYCPGEGLPVGVVMIYDLQKHKIRADYLGSDAGCGMMLTKFDKSPENGLEHLAYSVENELESYPRRHVDLGGGNHFINFYRVKQMNQNDEELNVGDIVALIHSGSGRYGKQIFEANLNGEDYLAQYNQIIERGKNNRKAILDVIRRISERKIEVLLDAPHNTVEIKGDDVIYRKGSIKLSAGQLGVIPSSMAGEAILIRAKKRISELENSMVHGTGRKLSRSDAKLRELSFDEVRKQIYIPSFIPDDHIQTEHPECYRQIMDILPVIEGYADVIGTLQPQASVL